MQINKLKAKLVEKGINVETLADLIGVDRSTLYRKLNNGEKITLGEAKKIKDALDMTAHDSDEIFLA